MAAGSIIDPSEISGGASNKKAAKEHSDKEKSFP